MHGGSHPWQPQIRSTLCCATRSIRTSERILDRQSIVQEHLSILTAPLGAVACLIGVSVGHKEGLNVSALWAS